MVLDNLLKGAATQAVQNLNLAFGLDAMTGLDVRSGEAGMKNFVWQDDGGESVDQTIMEFMAGEDVVLDRELFPFDIQATAAHVRGLARIGILSAEESQTLCRCWSQLKQEFEAGDSSWMSAMRTGTRPLKCSSLRQVAIPGQRFIPGAAATTRWQWQRACSEGQSAAAGRIERAYRASLSAQG